MDPVMIVIVSISVGLLLGGSYVAILAYIDTKLSGLTHYLNSKDLESFLFASTIFTALLLIIITKG